MGYRGIKVHYVKTIRDLSLEKFSVFILRKQKWGNKYEDYIAGQYYQLLTRGPLCDNFMETFLKIVQEKED